MIIYEYYDNLSRQKLFRIKTKINRYTTKSIVNISLFNYNDNYVLYNISFSLKIAACRKKYTIVYIENCQYEKVSKIKNLKKKNVINLNIILYLFRTIFISILFNRFFNNIIFLFFEQLTFKY